MMGRAITISVVSAILLLAILLQTTTPTTIGPLGILIVFILMYIAVLGVLTFLLVGVNHLLVKFSTSLPLRRPVQALSLRRAYYFASVIALAPVMFLGMQSVGTVGVYDVLLVVAFVTMACMYIAKRAH